MKKAMILTILLLTQSAFANIFDGYREEIKKKTLQGHAPNHSYKQARMVIMQNLHLQNDSMGHYVKDVYCRIKFRTNVGPNDMPNHTKINVEHTWPRSRFGTSRGSSKFRIQEADLHHLYPTDSRTNSTRGNYFFSEFPSSDTLADCISSKKGIISETGAYGFEPPAEHKGNVARSLFYFAVRYDMRIPEYEEFYLRQWHLFDPVDSEEIQRNDSVEAVQGNRNPFVDEPELTELINDF